MIPRKTAYRRHAAAIAAILLSSIVIVACTPAGRVSTATYRNASVNDLAAMLKERAEGRQEFLLINTHIPYEGHIEGTDGFWTFDDLPKDRLPSDKDTPIVVYCRSGRMSMTAAQTLVDMGYADVTNIEGGMNSWREAGWPLMSTAPSG